ncbi:hypothetical protein ACSFA8_13035 [Variovorax sp. RT4R15]|uniref:hypothetical protein n=1 Tax=Variovorax sp. RT4R15 TaxID=3443737 RepID=UPI003F48F981
MKHVFKVAVTVLALLACIVALGAVASLLFEAFMGVRGDFGPLGMLLLAALLVGQCRILWVLVHPGAATQPSAAHTKKSVSPAHADPASLG